MTININNLHRLALDGDLAAMQEIVIPLEAAEKERDECNRRRYTTKERKPGRIMARLTGRCGKEGRFWEAKP